MKKSSIIDRARAFIARKREQRAPMLNTDRAPIAVGRLVIEKRTPGGDWAVVVDDPNLVVTQAEGLMANMAAGVANAPLNYIELGNPSPATAPALGDLTLQSTTGQRKAATLTVSGNVTTAEVVFLTTEANGFTYTEAGLFTGPFAAGSMFARKTFAGITKTAAFELRFRWHITFLVQTNGGDCTGIGIIGPATVSSYTYLVALGGEASAAATYDFAVGANHNDVFLNGQRLVPGINYNEAGPPLTAPILGNPLNKGVNFVGFVLLATDKVLLVHRTLA
jgi:hypothetical protein